MSERALAAARELVVEGRPLLVLLSGGGDSVCLLDVSLRLGADVSALHVNYGLRDGADADAAFCRALCERLGASLTVERVTLPREGNLQDHARSARYALAERLAVGDYAAAHTLSDQAETVLYRLAVSPGSRALRGMAPRRGRLVRPLLEVTRAEVRDYLRARGLDWREDPSNADRRFARARVREDALAALSELDPAAERTIAETARQLREEGEVLDALADDALARAAGLESGGLDPAHVAGLEPEAADPGRPGAPAPGSGDRRSPWPPVELARLRQEPFAVARIALRRLVERAAGAGRPLSRREADELLAPGDAGTRSVDLGGGLRGVAEYGWLRIARADEETQPPPVALPVPGRVRFGDWEVEATIGDAGGEVSVAALGAAATVRGWRDGDRMRPLGLGGSKSLQDLFTDRKVPRALRRTLPVVEAQGEIVWVAGVALDERWKATPGAPDAVGLSARSLPRGSGT
jgi:tRNA(Ile)-lysidine synthase